MVPKVLTDAFERAQSWPSEAQEELAAVVEEIEAGLKGGVYYPTAEELAGIERGIAAMREGRIATEEDIAAAFDKHRPALVMLNCKPNYAPGLSAAVWGGLPLGA